MQMDGTEAELTDAIRSHITDDVIMSFGGEALRCVMVAQRNMVDGEALDDDDAVFRDLTLMALCGIQDPERPEVPKVCYRYSRWWSRRFL